jgi:hypothetical protein
MTETRVAYHADGYDTARPAINVKLHDPWGPGEYAFAAAVGDNELAEAYLNRAFDRLQGQFWQDAEELGLGPITQEGCSGGWLVFTDGRDPQLSSYFGNIAEEQDEAVRDWLAAYRAMVAWVESELASAPERVRNLAQQLAMDEVGREAGERAFATFRNREAVPA